MSVTYTYLLYHIPTKKNYYGVRTTNLLPKEDLWVCYFSSSKYVHSLIKEYGKDSFKAEVRKSFVNKQEAYIWEQKVIDRINAIKRDDWLNRTNNIGPFYHKGPMLETTKKLLSRAAKKQIRKPMSAETKRKISIANKGKRSWLKGKKLSKDTKRKIGDGNRGKIRTEEDKEKNRIAHIGKKVTEGTKRKISLANRGKVGWWKGKTQSPETIKKRVQTRHGYKHSEETKEKIRQSHLNRHK